VDAMTTPWPSAVVVRVAILTITAAAVVSAIQWRRSMHGSWLLWRNDQPIEASVMIRRPIDDVFSFYRDFRNLSRFLGDVTVIEPLDRATYRWTIQGPLGVQLTGR
jgi:uncharacterized membrane protein